MRYWPIIGMVLTGALAAGGCAGALLGQYAMTGALSPKAGWDVPAFGVEQELAGMPPPTALGRTVETPRYVGYPIYAPAATTPAEADAAARAYDALYDEPADPDYGEPVYYSPAEAEPVDAGPPVDDAPRELTRQITLPTSSATSSAPVLSAVTPTGRPIALPSAERKPVSTSIGLAPGAGSPRAPNGT